MESILWLYAQPYDPDYPVVCLDERPCFLIGDVIEPRAMQTGRVRKQHYAYQKLGSCNLFAAIEPLTGQRIAQIYKQRRKKEFTLFCQEIATHYPTATKIRLVLDNLNTHNTSAFYEHLPAAEAFALAQRFEFFYTPKSASWLNMIEIEFSALTRLCLNRRIPTIEQLESELFTLIAQRTEKRIKSNWQFSLDSCRTTLNSSYSLINMANSNNNV